MQGKLAYGIILGLIILGGFYGHVSAEKNINPAPVAVSDGMPAEQIAQVAEGRKWQPSPVWLPAYLVCTVPHRTLKPKTPSGAEMEPIHITGFGLEKREGGGYGFSSSQKRSNYRLACIAVGAALGLVVAVIVVFATGLVRIRKPPKEPEPPRHGLRPPPTYPAGPRQ